MIKAILHALCLDHSPSLSAGWTCPCKLCALANPDKLTVSDGFAKGLRRGMCGRWAGRDANNRTLRCMRAAGHDGRCLP